MFAHIYVWDTVGLLIDNHSKTHMIFIWSVLYSRCVSLVMICSGNFAWTRYCGLLPVDGSKGMRSAPARRWNSGRGQHGLVSCGSGWWELLMRAEHSSGPWRIDVSWRHGKPHASFGVMIWVSKDVTPFWTVTDNPTPFCGRRQFTPDTELAVCLDV